MIMVNNKDSSEVNDVIDIYSSCGNFLGTRKRNVAHDLGLWHYAIHCWVYYIKDNKTYLIFQKRNSNKRLFPGKFDVSAAGHYLCGEYGKDGLRELSEELNLPLSKYDIRYLKTTQCLYSSQSIINKEFCNIYLCRLKEDVDLLCFNKSEIDDMVIVDASLCLSLLQGQEKCVFAYSFKKKSEITLSKNDFILEYTDYFIDVISSIKERDDYINNTKKYTFVMLKPDTIKRDLTVNIVSQLKSKGFSIELFDVRQVVDEQIYNHYAEKILEEGEIYKTKAYKYFHGERVVPMILSHERDDIIEFTRSVVGYKDPTQADKNSIRGMWGIDSMELSEQEVRCCENLIHASDSYASFVREIMLWFKRKDVERFVL